PHHYISTLPLLAALPLSRQRADRIHRQAPFLDERYLASRGPPGRLYLRGRGRGDQDVLGDAADTSEPDAHGRRHGEREPDRDGPDRRRPAPAAVEREHAEGRADAAAASGRAVK